MGDQEIDGEIELNESEFERGRASAPLVARSPFGALHGEIVVADDFDELGPEWDPYVESSPTKG